jgi:chromosomal replication initiator protein
MYLARRLTGLSLEQIGGYFGGRDHTTVLHASRAVAEQISQDAELRHLVDEIALEVKNAAD